MMEAWKTTDFVSAGLYEDERAVVQNAVRALLPERPQLQLELGIHRYRNEEISPAKAAALAGVSWERMREIPLSRGVQPRLSPESSKVYGPGHQSPRLPSERQPRLDERLTGTSRWFAAQEKGRHDWATESHSGASTENAANPGLS